MRSNAVRESFKSWGGSRATLGLWRPNRTPHPKRNGKLRIPIPFEDAMKAAIQTRPPEKLKKKRRAKKS